MIKGTCFILIPVVGLTIKVLRHFDGVVFSFYFLVLLLLFLLLTLLECVLNLREKKNLRNNSEERWLNDKSNTFR